LRVSKSWANLNFWVNYPLNVYGRVGFSYSVEINFSLTKVCYRYMSMCVYLTQGLPGFPGPPGEPGPEGIGIPGPKVKLPLEPGTGCINDGT